MDMRINYYLPLDGSVIVMGPILSSPQTLCNAKYVHIFPKLCTLGLNVVLIV